MSMEEGVDDCLYELNEECCDNLGFWVCPNEASGKTWNLRSALNSIKHEHWSHVATTHFITQADHLASTGPDWKYSSNTDVGKVWC